MPDPTRPGRLGPIALTALVLAAGAYLVAGEALAPGDPGPATAEDPVDRRIELNITAFDCPPGYDNHADDDVCLGFDGQIPGPTLVFEQGEHVALTLNHRVEETIDDTSASPELADELSSLRYTLHRHGINVTNCDDGVARPRGTQVCDSTVGPTSADPPNGSVTYEFQTRFPGYWHYHDHSLGLNAGTVRDNVAGVTAEHRGLFGAHAVLPADESSANVLDLHLLDPGPNGGIGLDETVQAGERFDLLAVGLGNDPWTVTLEDPDGDTIWRREIGPGVSRGFPVQDATEGVYEWTASSPLIRDTYSGQVVVE